MKDTYYQKYIKKRDYQKYLELRREETKPLKQFKTDKKGFVRSLWSGVEHILCFILKIAAYSIVLLLTIYIMTLLFKPGFLKTIFDPSLNLKW